MRRFAQQEGYVSYALWLTALLATVMTRGAPLIYGEANSRNFCVADGGERGGDIMMTLGAFGFIYRERKRPGQAPLLMHELDTPAPQHARARVMD